MSERTQQSWEGIKGIAGIKDEDKFHLLANAAKAVYFDWKYLNEKN